ncbi:MAG: hypothetical protein IH951_12775 [Bacteroidetes bacterium]|nr:hypothetical protein [Bacteroidota bacterium]
MFGLQVYLNRAPLIILAIFFVGESVAQSTRARFEHLSTQDGLSHADVYAIIQDRHGFMWFGTKNGLDRFDGHSFRHFYHQPTNQNSLSDNWITSLLEDREGNIWIGTRNAGINMMPADSVAIVRFPFSGKSTGKGLLSGNTNGLLQDRNGRIWIATDGGLSRLDPETGRFTHFLHDSTSTSTITSDSVERIFEDSDGNIWVASWKDGLSILDPLNDEVTRVSELHAEIGRITGRVRALNEDQYGNLLLGTTSGFIVWNQTTDEFKRYRSDPDDPASLADNKVWAIHEDRQGKIWIGTYDGGVNRFERESGTFTRFLHDPTNPQSLSNNIVDAIFEDRAGMLWIATENGVDRYNLHSEAFDHFVSEPFADVSLSSNDVRAIKTSSVAPDIIWIGTSGGLTKFDRSNSEFSVFRHLTGETNSIPSDLIFALDEDDAGRLWLGSPDAGVSVFDPKSETFTHYKNDPDNPISLSSNAVHSLVVGDSGVVWIGTDGGGLNRLDPRSGEAKRYRTRENDAATISDDHIGTLYQSQDGRIWIGTFDSGVNVLDPATSTIDRIDLTQGGTLVAALNRVTSITEDAAGIIWIGTYGGLVRYAGESLRVFSSLDGLPGGAVLGLAVGQGDKLWLTTSHGISRFSRDTNTFINYGQLNGLPDLQFNLGTLSLSTEGIITAGGKVGYLEFPVSALTISSEPPALVMTSVLVRGNTIRTDVYPGETIELSHRDGLFSFEFALLDYSAPSEHVFQIILSEFEDGSRFSRGAAGRARYANVEGRSGELELNVQATADGINWTESTFFVSISPPWWRTAFFLSFFIIGLSSVFAVIIWYGAMQRKMKAHEKRQMLAEGREKERLLITRVIHDAPLQNLYAVQHKLELLESVIPPENRENGLEAAKQLLRQTGDDLRSLIGELRPPTIGPFGLEPAIRDHVHSLQNGIEDLTIHFDFHGEGPELPDQLRLTLFRIYQGAISNVLRHAEAKNAWISVRYDVASLSLEIRDDGNGFKEPNNWVMLARNKQYGMLGISEWAESAGGTLRVNSTPGKGTQILVTIPLEASLSVRLHNRIARVGRILSRGET